MKRSPPLLLRRLVPPLFMVLLLLFLFYLNLLQSYDLMSVLLGVLVCLVGQLAVMEWLCGKEMCEQGKDQLSIISAKICGMVGEIPLQYIIRKNKEKYYHRSSSPNSPLFSQKSSPLLTEVMSHLRAHTSIDHSELIRKIKAKWIIYEGKISSMRSFIQAYRKQLQIRIQSYGKWAKEGGKTSQSQWREWATAMKFIDEEKEDERLGRSRESELMRSMDHRNAANNSTLYLSAENKELPSMTYKQLIKLNRLFSTWVEEYYKNVKNKSKEIAEFHKDFNATVIRMGQINDQNVRKREQMLRDYKNALIEKDRLEKDIGKSCQTIDVLSKEILKNKVKRSQDVELILKNEFDLRLAKVELQNLQVKLSRAISISLLTSESLFGQCQFENRWLQSQALQVFNNKLANYACQLLQFDIKMTKKWRSSVTDLKDKNQQTLNLNTINNQSDFDVLLTQYNGKKRAENGIKSYLSSTIALLGELSASLHSGSKLLQSSASLLFKPTGEEPARRMKTSSESSTLTTYATNLYDRKFMQVIEALHFGEVQAVEKIRSLLEKQLKEVEDGGRGQAGQANIVARLCEEYKKKVDQLNKLKKKSNNSNQNSNTTDAMDTLNNRLIQLIFQMQKIVESHQMRLLPSYLPKILQTLFNHSTKTQKYIEQQQKLIIYQNEVEQKEREEEDSLRKEKYEDYMKYYFKVHGEADFDQNQLNEFGSKGDTNDKRYGQVQSREQQDRRQSLKFSPPNLPQYSHYKQSKERSLTLLNSLLSVLFAEWSTSAFFHQFLKEELMESLNRKKPDIVDELEIEWIRVVEKNGDALQNVEVHQSQIFRFLIDATINFKGKIAVQIGTVIKLGNYRIPLRIQLLIQQFRCPIRICFNPYCLEPPSLVLELAVIIANKYNIHKIPFFTKIIKTFIAIKMRRKMLWPKRMTMSVPLSVQSSIKLAIQMRRKYERDRDKYQKKSK